MKTRTMTRTQAELLLAAVIIARSTSYVLTKVGLQDMGKFTLLAVRFLLAFAFLAALFRRLLQIDRRTLLSGLAMGGIYFCVMTAELTALKTVETSTVSFVTNTAVVIVPLIQAALSRRWPDRRVLFGALACLLGVALLTLRGGLTFTPGVGYCILEAFLYSTAILVTDRLTHAGADPLLSGCGAGGVSGRAGADRVVPVRDAALARQRHGVAGRAGAGTRVQRLWLHAPAGRAERDDGGPRSAVLRAQSLRCGSAGRGVLSRALWHCGPARRRTDPGRDRRVLLAAENRRLKNRKRPGASHPGRFPIYFSFCA